LFCRGLGSFSHVCYTMSKHQNIMKNVNLISLEIDVLRAITNVFAQCPPGSIDASALQATLTHLQRIKPSNAPALTPRTLPVCCYLAQTLSTTGPASNAATLLFSALEPLLPTLAWIQNPNYQVGNMPAGFLENYGYADIVSGRGLIADDEFALGMLLLGPNTAYPPHHHPAAEIYYTIGGAARWWQTEQDWVARPPGSFVYHPSGAVHAMQTEAEPVCLLYAWWGNVQTAAQLTR